ncbi:DUF6612 family protein [Salisediminibacterium halotolerans]|uniref:Uncharacterized protein n=1 Tax=Salisediminibacterium halotolerans TaxID=517425 RepID=A0A1H9UVA3_9BACI|nr:DUF6612 family protein [Salisediminibacterium haloalkalitolerans]SES12987.1 hypothetical protein SAMN05444126_1161 [Salisediminibacterium haloalkalitolerans]
MKKYYTMGLTGLTVITLAACNNNVTDGGEDPEEILNQSMEAMDNLDSYGIDMATSQSISTEGEDEAGDGEFGIETTTEMDMTLDPLSFSQTMTMNLPEMEDEANEETDDMTYLSYFHEDEGFFMEDSTTDTWFQLEDDMMEDYLMITDQQVSPDDQLQVLEDHISDISMDESDSAYVITLETEEMNMQELMEDLDGMGMDGMDGMDEMFTEMFEETDIESMNFQVSIDKDTYYQTESLVELSMKMDMMGQSIQTSQENTIMYRDFDEIDEIEIPQDVIDSAEQTDSDILNEDLDEDLTP